MFPTKEVLNKIWTAGISYEDYLYLCSVYGSGLITPPSSLIDVPRLKRLNFLQNYELTKEGLDLINEIEGQKSSEEQFREFWNLFPSKDPISGRELKHSYSESLVAYAAALNEFGHVNLMESLRREIEFRSTLPSGLKYMKGLLNYLLTKEYKNVRDDTTKKAYGKIVY